MSEVVIVLIVIGLIFIFVSFYLAEKMAESIDEENKEGKLQDELTTEQKENIDHLVSAYIIESVDSKLNEADDKLSSIVNEKMLALGDYAVTVNDEIEKNHNEVVFMYSMLNDKQKDIYETATIVDEYRKDIENYVKQNFEAKFEDKTEQEIEQAIKDIDENIAEAEMANAEEKKVESVDSSKDVILEMYRSGYSILEIAKYLGLGVGEVKLVVDLYQGGHEK